MHLAHLLAEERRAEQAREEAEKSALEKKRRVWLAEGPPASCKTPEQVAAWRAHVMARVA